MRSSIALASLLLFLAACGPPSSPPTPTADAATAVPTPVQAAQRTPTASGPEMLPILASSELATGPNRFMFSLTDRENRLLAAPDVEVHLLFYDVDESRDEVAFEADARFLWAVEDVSGLYVANVEFPSDGRWGTRFNASFPDGSIKTVRADYDVLAETRTPAIGEQAPSVDTPTAADVGGDLAQLSSDDEPEPRFYETSIADVLATGEPFVVAFATPAFCQTATCGPTLEAVKAVAAEYPDVTFVNVEPYVMAMRDGSLQPVLDAAGQLQPAPWTLAWALVTEPFVAVVDADGAVRAKFEGALAPDELQFALAAL